MLETSSICPWVGLCLCNRHRPVSFRKSTKAHGGQVGSWASFHHKPGSAPPTEQLGSDKWLFLNNKCFVGKYSTLSVVAFYFIFPFLIGYYKSVANCLHSYTELCMQHMRITPWRCIQIHCLLYNTNHTLCATYCRNTFRTKCQGHRSSDWHILRI